NKTSITDALNNATTIAYNSVNKPTLVTNALGQKLSLSYDPNGQLLEVVNNAGYRTTVTRDAQGRVTSLKDPADNVTLFDHTDGCFCGKPGKIINPDGSFRHYQYNSFGQTTLEVNELGGETRSFYDSEGRLTATEDAEHHRTSFTYRGNVQEMKTD